MANVTIYWDYTCNCYDCYESEVNMTTVQTDPDGYFQTTFVVPSTVGGVHEVSANDDYMSWWAYEDFKVLVTLIITPDEVTNDGTKVTVIATGLSSYSMLDEAFIYDLCLDYEKDFYLMANCSGIIEFEFYATAGMEPGIHAVALYHYAGFDSNYPVLTLDDVQFFTVMTEEDPEVIMKLDETLTELADIDTTLTDIADDVSNIDFSAIQDAISAAQTDVLGAIADVEAVAQNAATAATEASTSAGTAAQAASDAKTASEATQGTVSGISTAVYLAIVLALVAALAAIAGVILLQRKVA
jgi:hypothetical protein